MEEIPLPPHRGTYRLLELMPALLTWGSFVGITWLSFYAPGFIASLVLIYVIYWFAKSLLMSVHLISGYRNYQAAIATDWRAKLETDELTKKNWEDIYQLVVVANAKEELPIVDATLEALTGADYPLKNIIILLANEEKYATIGTTNAKALEKKYGKIFGGFYATLHPMGRTDEVPGKGANITHAVEQILPDLAQRQLADENVLVTTLDADHRVHPSYFASLAYTYLRTPDRTLKSFQPLPMFFNNIWLVPFVIRSVSVGSSFWQMIEATRPYRLRTFAAHTQSLTVLKQSKLWSRRTIVEDGHQYWRSFFATGGRHSVVPLFIPIYQDAVLSPDGHIMTYREQYLQKRRWAYGVSDVPYVLIHMWRGRHSLPFSGWVQAFRLIEGHYSWAATSLILAIFGWLPTLINPAFQSTVLAYNFTLVYQRLLTLAMVGMVISLVLTRLMLPPRPKIKLHSNDIIEWALTPFLLPVANIAFGSFAAIDAQTRLAFGKYLGFRVTEKSNARAALPVKAS